MPTAARQTRRPTRRKPENLRLHEITPTLTVNDAEASVAWYRDVLGFIVEDRWDDGDQLHGAMLKAGTVRLIVGQDDFKKGRDRVKGVGFSLYLSTRQNLDDLAATMKARGAKFDHVPTDQPWGDRTFGVVDPDGFKLVFMAR